MMLLNICDALLRAFQPSDSNIRSHPNFIHTLGTIREETTRARADTHRTRSVLADVAGA